MVENPEDQGFPDTPENNGSKPLEKNRWMIAAFIGVALILVGILAYAMLSSAGIFAEPEPTRPAAFISITEPTQGARLDTTWQVNVRGNAGGLFEGNVIIQALDAAGEVLAQQPTTIDAPDAGIGGAGTWSVDLKIVAEHGILGQIVAFSTSPEDGSTVAADSVDVGYGESFVKDELLKIEDHFWRLFSLNERPLIENTHITLEFENFQAVGTGGCNNYFTSYERSSTDINFGFVASTAMECELPEGILAQESSYFNDLELVVTYNIEEKQLNMFDNSGNLLLVYDAVVMGSVVVTEGMELPEGAIVHVMLNDVFLADAEANLISKQIISDATQFPIPFSVKYNPKQIVDNHTYAISVRIVDSSENLLFISPSAYHVITGGNPSQVDIFVEMVQ